MLSQKTKSKKTNSSSQRIGSIMDGFLSKLQRYSTNDGPGIRTVVYAVGCPMNCLWCINPELIGEAAKFLYHPKRCIGCGACVAQSGRPPHPAGEDLDISPDTSGLEESSVVCYYDAYERTGGVVDAKELVYGLLRDKSYYDQSGGGVTFSGGDAGMQTEFFCDVAKLLRYHEVHIALDTAGYFPWDKLAPLVAAVDLVLYDIKTLSRTLHKRYTGVDNQMILENAMRIADTGKDMTVRMILVPGVNDSEDEIVGRLKFAKNLGKHVKVELIKYRKLEEGKYASLGMIEMMEGTPECTDDLAEHAANHARNMGLAVSITG